MATVISEKVGLTMPSVQGSVDKGSLETEGEGLVFRGEKRVRELKMSPIRDVWTESSVVHVDYGPPESPQSIGFIDLTQGMFKAAALAEPLADAIRQASGAPPPSAEMSQERANLQVVDMVAAGEAQISRARAMMGFGAVLLAAGVIALVASQGAWGWILIVLGAGRILASYFDQRDGQTKVAGTYKPIDDVTQKRILIAVLIGGALIIIAVLVIAYWPS